MTQDTAQASTTFGESTLQEYLDQLAAKVPAPGGGAVAALHAAQGAALVAMVARYTTRAKDAEHQPVIERIIAAADAARAKSLTLADADAAAFTAVGNAYKLPKDDDEQLAARNEAITAALLGAARVPAAVVAVADEIVSLATELLPIGNPNVVTDIGAAADCARSAAASSQLNIAINVASLGSGSESEFAPVLTQIDEVIARADALHDDVVAAITK
ncbi:cyclodeaminase/cyclohydrolase family protein [Nocardia huaxiensis]|uniref:cyclodeaminase/cyclohydrolase family protein n=1 Tax=Nocardia huaxiensis TaxID=2755382 RepID=UPI001E3548EC|nr:cyclodeaminase/cyclohydrolase family protein [Nocardia huaxiensis]UFS98795.1 cyclodeaminase/cyclohydrolase family protein [Nocardia huaxiensis]